MAIGNCLLFLSKCDKKLTTILSPKILFLVDIKISNKFDICQTGIFEKSFRTFSVNLFKNSVSGDR